MKTSTFLILLIPILFIACNPDDESVDCEPFIDNGIVNPILAEGLLNANLWDTTTDLIFVNNNQDSLVFEAQNKFIFPNNEIVKTACENGDSTSNIYEFNAVNKSFTNSEYNLNLSANSRLASEFVDQGDGTLVSHTVNCVTESLTASFNSIGFTNSVYITQRFNPDNCPDFGFAISNFTLESSIELNGVTFDNILVSNDLIFGTPVEVKLYFSNDLGFIAFEDVDDVLWMVMQ